MYICPPCMSDNSLEDSFYPEVPHCPMTNSAVDCRQLSCLIKSSINLYVV